MAKRPKDPNEAFAQRAKQVVEQTLEQQKLVTKDLQEQTGKYIGANAPQDYDQAIRELGKASGRAFPDYVGKAEGDLGKVTNEFIKGGRAFGPGLNNFSPNLLASNSTSQLTDYLSAVGQQFAEATQDVGEAGRDRLFALPEQAQKAFTASALNPAFENLRNAEYVNFAKEPPTVANDAMKMYRNIFTYNV
jgi:hypothetical protein